MLSPFKMAADADNLINKTAETSFAFSGVINDDNFRVWRFSLDDDVYVSDKEYSMDEPVSTRTCFFSPESDYDEYDEPASYSIINLKNVSIDFKYRIPDGILGMEEGEEKNKKINEYIGQYVDFVKNKVLFYLKQMIPATTIFEYNFVGQE